MRDEASLHKAETQDAGPDAAGPHLAGPRLAGNDNLAESITEDRMNGKTGRHSRWRRRILLIAGAVVLAAAGVVLPPLINIGRYQSQIAALMSRSLGRPVQMSSVELRLLPLPGFVLHDLAVSEDPAFGAEPILSARTVVASVRLLSLWRGRLEISRVSVDEASLNLVRSAQGRWNLNSLVTSAAPALTGSNAIAAGNTGHGILAESAHFPYLEATDSRVNLKNGVEKSPFSLAGTDLSLWQDEPGEWRVRLRGQPVRTDMEMSLADTGEVQMEASLHSAGTLREMPLKLQMEWRDAQLGQLSRLLFGSDAGWRGDVTADIDVQGTPDSALTKARLRATGVRREEFAPETPLDFDANCSFRYQHSLQALHNVGCDTSIGDGRLHLKAELPGTQGKPEAMLEVKDIPVQAGLDLLRTLRGDFAPGIAVKGTANGSLTYKEPAAADKNLEARRPRHHVNRPAAPKPSSRATEADALPTNLQGSLILDGVVFKGGDLKEPLLLPRMTWEPVPVPSLSQGAGGSSGLGARFTIALAPALRAQPVASQPGTLSSAAPAQAITVQLALGAHGYDARLNGSAETARLRDLVYAFGLPHLDAADGFTGGTADFDFAAEGPWIPSTDLIPSADLTATSQPVSQPASQLIMTSAGVAIASRLRKPRRTPSSPAVVEPEASPGQDALSVSLVLHRTQWKAGYLARPVDLGQAVITLSRANIALTSDFSYGNVKDSGKDPDRDSVRQSIKGSVSISALTNCKPGTPGDQSSSSGSKASDCEPQVQLRFGALDAATVETALLGAPEEKTLFSPLIDRMRSSDRPKWPEVVVNVQADSLALGPATLQKPVLRLKFKSSEITIEAWQAGLLAGSARGTGSFAGTADKPEFTFDGSFTRLNAASLGALLGSQWAGGAVSGSGSIQLSGLTASELGASATGNVQFDWPHGAISATPPASDEAHPQPYPRFARFDDWSGTVAIAGGKAQLGENALRAGGRNSTVAGVILFGGPAKLIVAPSENKLAAHAGQSASLPVVK